MENLLSSDFRMLIKIQAPHHTTMYENLYLRAAAVTLVPLVLCKRHQDQRTRIMTISTTGDPSLLNLPTCTAVMKGINHIHNQDLREYINSARCNQFICNMLHCISLSVSKTEELCYVHTIFFFIKKCTASLVPARIDGLLERKDLQRLANCKSNACEAMNHARILT